MKSWSGTYQLRRRDAFYTRYLAHMEAHPVQLNFREAAWHCLALLHGGVDEQHRANDILGALEARRCHFTPVTYLQILTHHAARIDPDVRDRMRTYVRESLGPAASPAIHVTMYNDNFAALACYTLVVGGEMLGDAAALASGRAKLRGFAEHFRRRGTVMEYGSPTYTPVHTHVFAALAEHARDSECRSLALGCEERMWAEIASHWHGPSGHLAGPYSRAYWVDTVGHPHQLHAVLWLVFGEAIIVNPLADLLPPHDGQVIHVGLERLMLPGIAWLMTQRLHCPDRLARRLLHPRFPAWVSAVSESLPSRITGNRTWKDGRKEMYTGAPEYPAFAGPNTAYLEEDFSLAAGYSGYHDGALTETFYATYRRRRPALGLEHTGVALARFVFNDHRPEQSNYYSVYDSVHGPEGFRNEARVWGIQKGAVGMYAFRPKPFEAHEVTSMMLCILFPTHFGGPEEIWLGHRKLGIDGEAVLGSSTTAAPVCLRDGPVFFAFRPLEITDLGRAACVRVERWPRYLAICLVCYEGAARAFDDATILRVASGFVAHVGSDARGATFAAFRERSAAGELTDRTTESEGGLTRWIRYRHPHADLELALSPASEGILRASVDGCPRPEPVFAATGIRTSRLPFLGRRGRVSTGSSRGG